jgi:hypothetical protein
MLIIIKILIVLVFFQIPLKHLLFEEIELLDEVILIFIILSILVDRRVYYSKRSTSILRMIFLMVVIISLSAYLNNISMLWSIISVRDYAVMTIILHLGLRQKSKEFIESLVRFIILIFKVEIIIALFQLFTYGFSLSDNIRGTFGPGGAHTLSMFIVLFLSQWKYIGHSKLSRLLFGGLSIIVLLGASYRSLLVIIPLSVLSIILLQFKRGDKRIVRNIMLVFIGFIVFMNLKPLLPTYLHPDHLLEQQNIRATGGRLMLFDVLRYETQIGTEFSTMLFGLGPTTFMSKTSLHSGNDVVSKYFNFEYVGSSNMLSIYSQIGGLGFIVFYTLLSYYILQFGEKNKVILKKDIFLLALVIASSATIMLFEAEQFMMSVAILMSRKNT